MNTGWFPDPYGQPGLRYFDGAQWTHHFAPSAAPGAPAAASGSHFGPEAKPFRIKKRGLVAAAVLGSAAISGAAQEHPWALALLPVLFILVGAGFWVENSARERQKQERYAQYERYVAAQRRYYPNWPYPEGDRRGSYGQ